jgi:hypothetical protein
LRFHSQYVNLSRMNTHSRIGKVKLKDTKVVPLNVEPRGLHLMPMMREDLETILDGMKESGIAGMVMVAWDFHGYTLSSAIYDKDSFVGRTFSPAFVAEVLRRRNTEGLVEDYLSGY